MKQDLKVLALGVVVMVLAMASCFSSYVVADLLANGTNAAILLVP